MIVRVATLRRGAIIPPEPLDKENARIVEQLPIREAIKRQESMQRKQVQRWAELMTGAA